MALEEIIVWLVVGAIAGWLAGLIMKGYGFGLIGNIVVGIIGAVIAGWLLPRIGFVLVGGIVAAIINAVIGAVIFSVRDRAFQKGRVNHVTGGQRHAKRTLAKPITMLYVPASFGQLPHGQNWLKICPTN